MAEPVPFEVPPTVGSTPDAGQTTAAPQRRSARRNALHLLYSQGMTWSLAMVLSVVQPRFLGPEAQGQLRLAMSIWGIAVVGINLGTNNHITLEIARRGEQGARDNLSTVLGLRVMTYLVACLGVVGYLVAVGADRDTVLVFVLVGVSMLPYTVSAVARAGLIGFENMGYVGIADVATKVVVTVLALAALFAGGSAVHVAGAIAAGTMLNAHLMWRYLRKFPGTSVQATLRGAPGIVRASAGFLVAEAVLILYLQVDTVVLSVLVGKEELGWYGTADTLFASLLFVPSILLSSLLPVIGRLHVEDPARLRQLIEQSFSSLVLVGVPMGLGTVVVAEPLAVLLFGEAFRQTGGVLAVLGVVLILSFCTILFGQVAVATGRQRFWNTLMGIAIAASIPLDLVFVRWMDRAKGNGAIGGGLSYLVTEGFMLVLGTWRIAPHVVRRDSLVRVLKIVLAGALMFAAAWPWRDRFLAVPVVLGAMVYVAAVFALRAVTDDERRQLAALAGRLTRVVRRAR